MRAPIGLLLVNLGSPDAPDASAVRRYLAEFLSDRRVVELSRALWLPILYGIILNTRPKRSAQLYARIWECESNDSPLKAITRRQAEKLQLQLRESYGEAVIVEHAMRYQNPSLEEKIAALMARGCERIAILPLYPQYAASTTATAFDECARILAGLRRQPTLRFAAPYFDEPAYIDALAQSLRAGIAALDFEPEVVLASFHGLPKFQIDRGDPYKAQAERTIALLREAMGMDEKRLRIAFQSRFGRAEWIRPYTSETVAALAGEGVRRLAVIAPGFSADCLETIEEIGEQIRDEFLKAGGSKFARLPCLNDSEEGMKLLETLAQRELAGWG